MTSVPRLRAFTGPALLSYGFRPLFLAGALYAAFAMGLWLPALDGSPALPTEFSPRDWHGHEMIYGYTAAVIAGFLLTAIPNWTGSLPLQGLPLLALAALWVLGRFAVSLSAWTGWIAAAAADSLFLLALLLATAREIAAGKNWRNLKIAVLVGLFLAGNIVFHLEAGFEGSADYGLRMGVAVPVLLIAIIGGRIVPSFTHNWLVRENPGALPIPFNRFDAASLAAAAAALALWCAAPSWSGTGLALAAAGLMHLARLLRWAGTRTWREPLVFILHAGYLFVPAGFLLLGASILFEYPTPAAGIHAWTAGGIGVMTLAVMSRASLGHTGRTLTASRTTGAIYVTAIAAALLRVWAGMDAAAAPALLHISAVLWIAAFLGFALAYWPVFTGPRLSRM